MSMPGWYPDPGGATGRYRFWDGTSWSPQSSASPADSAPTRPPNPQRRSDAGWVIALVVLLAVTLIAVGLFVLFGSRNPLGEGGATEDTNSSTPTVSAWDETSSPTPPPGGDSVVACPFSWQSGDTPQVNGKLTAGTLRVDQIAGWSPDGFYLPFTYDGHWQYKDIYPGWISNIGVALLANVDGFTDVRSSAEMVMECLASSSYYVGFTDRVDMTNAATTINGHPAWHIRSQIHVSLANLPQVEGDVVDIIVVDLGDGKDHLGLYTSAFTIDDTAVQQQVETAMATLTVTG
jgi:hypothetical protein